jgi:hypothetical protein
MIDIAIGKERYSYECIEYCKEFVLCFPLKNLKMEHGFVEKKMVIQDGKITNMFVKRVKTNS